MLTQNDIQTIAQLLTQVVGKVIEEKVNPQFQDLRERLGRVEQDVAVLKQDIITLKQDVSILLTDVATLKSEVATLKSDVRSLKSDVRSLKANRGVMMEEIVSLREDMTMLVEDNKNIKEDTEWLKTHMVTKEYLDDKLADLRGDLILIDRKQEQKINMLANVLEHRNIISHPDIDALKQFDAFHRKN